MYEKKDITEKKPCDLIQTQVEKNLLSYVNKL